MTARRNDSLSWARVLLHPLRREWDKWRYRSLARRHRLPIFACDQAERIGRQIAFAETFRQLQQHYPWIPRVIYPVGGAADLAFLCLVIRALTENELRCVFEFGAGQTTQLLAAWAKESGAEVFTFEENEFWAAKCRVAATNPAHHMIHAPLKPSASGDHWYDLTSFRDEFPAARADLLIIDGPVGTPQRSRIGIVDAFPDLCREEWAVIWDDVDRVSDLNSLIAFVESLQEKGIPFDMNCCQAFRTQALILTPRYRSLKHYC